MNLRCLRSWFVFTATAALVAVCAPAGVRGQSEERPAKKPLVRDDSKSKKQADEAKDDQTSRKDDTEGKNDKKEILKAFPKGPREDEFKKALGKGYQTRYTDHFVVFYNADEEVVKDFIARLEKTYESVHRFATRLKIKIRYPKEKLPVLFCNNFEEYSNRCQQFTGRDAPAEAAGLYFREPLNFSIFYDMSQVKFILEHKAHAKQLQAEAKTTKDPNERKNKVREAQWYLNKIDTYQQTQNRSVVQHELSHQLLFNFRVHTPGAANPQWFVEGMATQFEPPPGKMGAGFNVINQRRLGVIREKFMDEIPDLRDFVGDPAKGAPMLSDEGYALSWAMVHYLIKQKSKEFPRYVELLKRRKRGAQITPEQDIADFEECFGKIDDNFKKKWQAFVKGLPYRPGA